MPSEGIPRKEPLLPSYAQKITTALREKGVPFTAAPPDTFGTGRSDDPFAAANPRTDVPVQIGGAVSVFESTVILETIEERWPEGRSGPYAMPSACR